MQRPDNPWGQSTTVGPYIVSTDPEVRKRMALEEAYRYYSLGEQQCWARRDRMVDWLLAWHGQVTVSHTTQRSQLGHDITRESIERILPKLLGSDLRFSYYKQGQYNEPTSKLATHYLDVMHYFAEKLRTARDKCIYGRGVGKWRWVLDRRTRRRRLTLREIEAFQSLGQRDFPTKIDDVVTAYDGPKYHAVDPFAMTYDTSVDSPYKCAALTEEFRETARQMWNNVELELYDEAAVRAYLAEDNKQMGGVQRWRTMIAARLGIDATVAAVLGEPSGFALYESYFPFDMRGTLREVPTLVVCDPAFRHALRAEENPYDHGLAPYSFDDWMRVTGEFWSVGVAEMLEPVQTMVNVWANLAVDNIVLSVFNVWLKHREARIPGNVLRAIPNMMIPTDMMNGLEPLRPTDHTAQIQSWLQFYLKRAQEQSGVTAFSSLGTPELGQTKTALGIQTLKASAEEFLTFARRLMIEESMEYDARFLLELLQQFVDQDLDITIRGEDGRLTPFTVQPEDLDGDFEWRTAIEHRNPLSRELESQAFENWVATALKLGQPLNLGQIVIQMAKLREVQHPELYLGQPQPLQAVPPQPGSPGGGTGEGGTFGSLAGGPQPGGGAGALLAGEAAGRTGGA